MSKKTDRPVPAELVLVDGAGVDPAKVCRPAKRLKASHRKHGTGRSLKTYARMIYAVSDHRHVASWIAGKGIQVARP